MKQQHNEIIVMSRSMPFHGIGGMEIVAWDLCREFVRQGERVRVVTTSIAGLTAPFEKAGVTVVPLQGTPSGRYSRKWWRASQEYFEAECAGSSSVVLSVSAGAYGLLGNRKYSEIPIVLQAHGTSWGEVLSKWGSRKPRALVTSLRNLANMPKDFLGYSRVDALVAVGERVYNDLGSMPSNLFVADEKLHLIQNGIDTTLFSFSAEARQDVRQQLGIPKNSTTVISASRLHVQKGVEHGLRAFARFYKEHPEAFYLIAGDGPDRSRLESITRQLGITSHVFFLGALDRELLSKYLSAADLFIFLSDHVEGLPLNVLEALSTGLPAVVSSHLTLFESDAISYVAPRDELKVCELMQRLSSRLQEERRSLLPDTYSLENCAQQYLELFANLQRKSL